MQLGCLKNGARSVGTTPGTEPGEKDDMTKITHHCEECGEQVTEFCEKHPQAPVTSIISSTRTIQVKAKDVRWLTSQAFPGYHGRKATIDASGRVTFHDLHWGGGSCNQYIAVRMSDGARADLEIGNAPWACPTEGARVEIPEGIAIIESSVFCGKPMPLRIYVHPSNVGRFLSK